MNNSRLEKWLYYSTAAFALLLPVSIAVVQPAAYLASVLSLVLLWKHRNDPALTCPFKRPVLLFLAIVVVTAVLGVRPETSFNKINRFIILSLIWSIPFVFASRAQSNSRTLEKLAVLFVLGIAFKAAYDFVRVPTSMAYDTSLFHTGNMRDPQFYLTAICLASGMIIAKGWHMKYLPTAVGLLMAIGGMLIHFKRGAWAAVIGGLTVMAIASRRWRPLGIAAVLLFALLLIPPVRERLWQLKQEFNPENGGRMTLWMDIAPEIIPLHPFGMGWKAVKHEDFIGINEKVEPKLNHLHNNALQVILELGWAGLAVWLYWMGSVLYVFWNGYRKMLHKDAKLAGLSLGGLGAFSGLMLNGCVEYNFGDSEIFMMTVFLMALAAGVHRHVWDAQVRTGP